MFGVSMIGLATLAGAARPRPTFGPAGPLGVTSASLRGDSLELSLDAGLAEPLVLHLAREVEPIFTRDATTDRTEGTRGLAPTPRPVPPLRSPAHLPRLCPLNILSTRS